MIHFTSTKINYQFDFQEIQTRRFFVKCYVAINILAGLLHRNERPFIVDEVDKITKNKFLSLKITYFCCSSSCWR